ncbi:MAG TPA: M48 family metalloprotease [Terracidiphilus sp.]|nr:M48 family metalloprotease [Terracidiphilus sp.]
MKICATSLFAALAIFIWPEALSGQTSDQASCTIDPPQFATNAPNIFNDRQEQDLGDALAELAEPDLRIAPAAGDDELSRIGEKLLKTLPPTGIHYTFRIYESGEVNAFSIAGGRVYVSRKLIAAIKNEDELAGVLAHELGHLSTHQTAIAMTRLLRIRMGITEVGDRADIFAKVHQLFNTPTKEKEGEEKETPEEVVADHVAIFAMVRAGYAPASFPAFFNQITMNKGKTGNWLSDVFGVTNEDQKRFREATKLVTALPAGCAARQASASKEFLAWQQQQMTERVQEAAASATGDQPLKLDPPMRPNLWHITFSPDGKSVLAQDEASITVLNVTPPRVLFQIDAPDVNAAHFTPDSTSVVFSDSNLRVERWNVAKGQRDEAKEIVVYDGCNQTLLSPDGKTLACLNSKIDESGFHVGLRLIDVETGTPFFEKPKFFERDVYAWSYQTIVFALQALFGEDIATMEASPDGHYLMIVIGERVWAYDLEKRAPISVGGKLKEPNTGRIAFIAADQVFAAEPDISKSMFKARILSFPDGKPLGESNIGDQGFRGVTKGSLLIIGPVKDYAAAIMDPVANKILAGWKLPTMDVWEKSVAAEEPDGSLFLGSLASNDSIKIPLPLGKLPFPRAADFSPDGKYLIASLRMRATVWDLSTGKQMRFLRPMRNLWVGESNQVFAQLPKSDDMDATEVEFSLPALTAKSLGKFEDKDKQYGDLQYRFKPIGGDHSTAYHATLEVKRMDTQAVVWSRDYNEVTPAVWPASGNRLALAWDLSSDTAKSEVKKYAKAQDEAKALNNHKKGLLIETVTADTGAPMEQVALPEVDLSEGWHDERYAWVDGEFVLVHGEHDNTDIYRLDSGASVGEFFGMPLATDSAAGLIAAVNREDEILLVDESTGKELQRFTMGSPVRLGRILSGKEKMLLVLTADQVVHRIPLPK